MKKGDEQQLVMFLDRMTGVMNTEAMGGADSGKADRVSFPVVRSTV